MITSLTDWRVFEKKQKNAGIDIVICDVQETFHKFFGDEYLEKLKEYCEDYKRVFQIWDDKSTDKPDYDFPNQVGTYSKSYGKELCVDDVKLYFPESMWQTVFDRLESVPDRGDMFETLQGDTFVFVDSKHKWFMCPKTLMTLFKSIKTQERHVILVGGAEHECIEDIYVTMQALDVNVEYNPEYVYSFHGSKFQ